MKRYLVRFLNVAGDEVRRKGFHTRKEAEYYAHFVAPTEFRFNNYKIKKLR